MNDENATNAIALIPDSRRYEDAVWELLFEIWLFLADRNCTRTREKFLHEFKEHPLFNEDRIPSLRQIQHKARTENWDLKGNQRIRQAAELIDDSQLARLLVMSDKALELIDRVIEGEYLNHHRTGNLQIMVNAALKMLEIRGLGTAGAVVQPTLKLEVKSSEAVTASLTNDERAQLMRDRILAGKQIKKLTGKK